MDNKKGEGKINPVVMMGSRANLRPLGRKPIKLFNDGQHFTEDNCPATSFRLKEREIYGSSRIGTDNTEYEFVGATPVSPSGARMLRVTGHLTLKKPPLVLV